MTKSISLTSMMLCAVSLLTSAQAQPPNSERRIIISGPGGDQSFAIDQTGGPTGGANIVVIATKGPNGVFTFVGSPDELPFGGSLGPIGMMTLAAAGSTGSIGLIDPGISYIHQLIRRPDVRSDLFIDSKQRDQLDEMENEENQANSRRFEQLGGSSKSGPGASAGAASSTADGQGSINDKAKMLRDMGLGAADARDKRLAAILTQKQITRLKELDLQYRGPLAMGVKPVADKAKLTDAQAPAVAGLLKEYRNEVQKALGVEEKQTDTTSQDGSRRVSLSTNLSGSADELKARLEKAHDEIENARLMLGEKALKSVSDVQRTEWQSLTGRRFRFQSLN